MRIRTQDKKKFILLTVLIPSLDFRDNDGTMSLGLGLLDFGLSDQGFEILFNKGS